MSTRSKRRTAPVALAVLALAFLSCMPSYAQTPPTQNYIHLTNVLARLGAEEETPTADLVAAFSAVPGPVQFCDIITQSTEWPEGVTWPKYGDVEWDAQLAPDIVKYTVVDKWWEKPGVIDCEGFNVPTDQVWYKVANGNQCAQEPECANSYYEITFEPDPDDLDPITVDYPYLPPLPDAQVCEELCVDELESCLPLSALFVRHFATMADAFANNAATPNVDLWVETDPQYTPEGNCWPVTGKDGEEGYFKACYYQGDDCIRFLAVEGKTVQELAANSPYTFTYTVSNSYGGKATAKVTVEYPCYCCDRTKKLIEKEVIAGQTAEFPFTDLYTGPICEPAQGFIRSLITDQNDIENTDWQTFWGGFTDPGIYPEGIATIPQGAEFVRYTARTLDPCCEYVYDYFYIRTICLDDEGLPIPGKEDKTQVRVKVKTVCSDYLVKTTNSFWFNKSYIPPINDPCGDYTPGGWEPLCMGTYPVPVCWLVSDEFVETSNCWDALFISEVGFDGVANVTKLGGTVFITPGDQTGALVIYQSPDNVTETVTDEFEYVISDLKCGGEVVQKAYIVLEPCEQPPSCYPTAETLKIDVCNEGETVAITEEMMLDVVDWESLAVSCGISNACVVSITPYPDCNIRGSWRLWPSEGCWGDQEGCDDPCIKELRYMALPSQFATPGIDRFSYVIRYMENGEWMYLMNDIKIIVRPLVNPSELVTVDLDAETDVTQGAVKAVIISDLDETLYSQLSGYGDLEVLLAFEPVSANGGSVSIACVESGGEEPEEELIFFKPDGCYMCGGECVQDPFDPCEDDEEEPTPEPTVACALMYSPDPSFVGEDTITYHIWDGTLSDCGGELNMKSGTITVKVIRNVLAPIARADVIEVYDGQLTVSDLLLRDCIECGSYVNPDGILANDWWPSIVNAMWDDIADYIKVYVVTPPAKGLFNFQAQGKVWAFAYLPTEGVGMDKFTYRIKDLRTGLWSQPTEVLIQIVNPQVVRYATELPARWVLGVLWDDAAAAWTSYAKYLYAPASIEVPVEKVNNWYWFGVWDYSAANWAVQDWFVRYE